MIRKELKLDDKMLISLNRYPLICYIFNSGWLFGINQVNTKRYHRFVICAFLNDIEFVMKMLIYYFNLNAWLMWIFRYIKQNENTNINILIGPNNVPSKIRIFNVLSLNVELLLTICLFWFESICTVHGN